MAVEAEELEDEQLAANDIRKLADSWRWSLLSANKAKGTVQTYGRYHRDFSRLLVRVGMPTLADSIRREHVESFTGQEVGHSTRKLLVDAVIRLCRAPKTRIADHLFTLMWEGHEQQAREIPDFALDMHTSRGRRMGRQFGGVGKESHTAGRAWRE